MLSRSRILMALAVVVPLSVVGLTANQAVRNYPAEDGFILSNGELLGGDFIAFYVGGTLFDEEREQLYDLDHQREVRADILGSADDALDGELPFVYPPLVAALLAPLSRLPFQQAFLIWTLLGSVVGLAALLCLTIRSGASDLVPIPIVLLVCIGYVPFVVDTIFGGQAAWLGLALLAVVAVAVLHENDILAGAAMSLSYYKPPLFLLFLIVLLIARGRRFLVGFGAGAAILVGLTLASVGIDGLMSYWSTVSGYVYGQDVLHGVRLPPSQGMGIVALGVSLLSSTPVVLALLVPPLVAVTVVGVRLVRDYRREMRRLGLMVCITTSVAFSLQVIKYDLALLLVPMVLAVPWYWKTRSVRRLAVLLSYLGFYFEFAFRQVTVAGAVANGSWLLFVVSVSLLGYTGWSALRQPNDEHDSEEPVLAG